MTNNAYSLRILTRFFNLFKSKTFILSIPSNYELNALDFHSHLINLLCRLNIRMDKDEMFKFPALIVLMIAYGHTKHIGKSII